MSDTPWIVIKGGGCLCKRCGATGDLNLPSDVDDVVDTINRFTEEHSACPPDPIKWHADGPLLEPTRGLARRDWWREMPDDAKLGFLYGESRFGGLGWQHRFATASGAARDAAVALVAEREKVASARRDALREAANHFMHRDGPGYVVEELLRMAED